MPSPEERLQPQNLEAEQCLLGSLLLDSTQIHEVDSKVDGGSFYQKKHGTLFQAIAVLANEGKPVDAVLLREELSRRGLLEEVGGNEYLLALVNSVPSAANAEYYADIVREKALVRGYIQAATEILRKAYDASTSSEDLSVLAEQEIFKISQGQTSTATPIHKILGPVFNRILALRDRARRITGVPTGYYLLDDMISGLQPAQLLIVAGRPSMGKSSFALNIVEHVAIKEQQPVLVFSLEMQGQQVAQNMICSHARIDAHKVRKGTISEDEKARLVETATGFSSAPIFIDDSAGLTVNQIRSRARRFHLKEKLALIIIDYMQLIEVKSAEAGSRFDNRQTEISYISRSLKGLARELNVPVMALSQLNREVEKRTDHRPMLADLRECVTGDTLVLLVSGERVPIRELVGRSPRVVSMTSEGKLTTALADRVWRVGERAVCEVRLASGRTIRATAEHRLMGAGGWVRVGELAPGDRLALARRIPAPTDSIKWSPARVALLGHLIGDGSYLSGQPMRYTTSSEDNSRLVRDAARREFGATVKRYAGRRTWHQLLISGNGNRWHPAGVNQWLRELGIFGQRSWQKRVPLQAFLLRDEQTALLLRHLWATDGTISPRRKGPGSHAVNYSTNSPGLALDVAALLARLGIVARIHELKQGRHRPMKVVSVTGASQQRRFLEIVGAFGPKVPDAKRLKSLVEDLADNTNVDTLPRQTFESVRSRMREQGISHRRMAKLRGTSYGGSAHFKFSPSRSTLAEYAEILDDDELRAQCASDLFWDRVLAVRPAGREVVFDLTVPGTSSWLADGIVSHNSGAIEQDADVVMLLHRAGYYRDSGREDDTEAEVIIAKQRSGPVGKVELRWFKQFTRFDNAAAVHEEAEAEA
ncbi:MAG: replicative DNA helicase [Planctomycetes bacterium]|nr:replicative DNA helicase [Planctomycetota bacterium]